MPTEFQRVLDLILLEYPQAHAFFDDILFVTKGSEIEHIATADKILRKLDKGNMSLKTTECNVAQQECEWLGHKITHTGVTPLIAKVEPNEALKPLRTLT